MGLEDLFLALRELLHRVSMRDDSDALRSLVRYVLSVLKESNEEKLSNLMQVIHDEKTYVLADTEIAPGRVLELLRKAALYHALHELIRSVKHDLKCEIPDPDVLRRLAMEGNMTDLTDRIARALRCVIDNERVNDVLSRLRETSAMLETSQNVERPPDLKVSLCRYILEETAMLIDTVKEVKNNEERKN